MKKTNAVRILEKMNLPFQLRSFDAREWDLSAEMAAQLLGLHLEQVYKTLVARGDKLGVIIVSIPADGELDPKKLAALSGNKKVEMVSLKEVQPLTGYARGSVSPLGLKQAFPYYLDQGAFSKETIIISAGTRGLQIEIAPADLKRATAAETGQLTRTGSSKESG